MGQISNSEAFHINSSSTTVSNLSNKFKRQMDTVLRGGPTITIDLHPGQTDCPSSCVYNPSYDKYQDVSGGLCRTCRGQGFIMEPRYTLYKCNRRWTNEPMDKAINTGQDTIAGNIFGNYVRVKTVVAAWDHIANSIGASIDGIKVKLYKEPRKTGWGNDLYYVVSWWERMNK